MAARNTSAFKENLFLTFIDQHVAYSLKWRSLIAVALPALITCLRSDSLPPSPAKETLGLEVPRGTAKVHNYFLFPNCIALLFQEMYSCSVSKSK